MKTNDRLKNSLFRFFNLKPFLPGTLSKQYKTCGKPNCRCMDKENPQKHPSYQLTYALDDTRSTLYISKKDVQTVQEMTDMYKEVRKIINEISLEMVDMYRQYGAEKTLEITYSTLEKIRSKVCDGKPESGKLRDAKISRDTWKKRSMKLQEAVRKNIVKIRDITRSRDKWRNETLQLRKENKALKASVSQQEEKIKDAESSQWTPDEADTRPRHFTYTISTIRFAILMVIFGFNSLRGSAMNFKIFARVLRKGLPRWTTIQNWILRFGLYILLQPLPKRKDWIWIIDHTINFGTKKCFVVLAVTHEKFKNNNCQLTHKDMEVAVIDIQEKTSGKNIAGILRDLRKDIGTPLQIVSDNGSALKKGVEIFKKTATKTFITYDITHKVSNELRKILTNNRRWNEFINKIAETKRKSIYSEMAYLSPPKPRDKSRWLNLDFNIKWAEAIIENTPTVRPGRTKKSDQKFRELFGWLDEFKEDIHGWRLLLDVLNEAQKEVKLHGLSKETKAHFIKRMEKIENGNERVENLKLEIMRYFDAETARMKENTVLLGTSDIIESVFGSFKIFSGKTPMKEINKSVLTIPILTSEVTHEEVKKAMEEISHATVTEWLKNNIGETLFAKRRKALFKKEKQESV